MKLISTYPLTCLKINPLRSAQVLQKSYDRALKLPGSTVADTTAGVLAAFQWQQPYSHRIPLWCHRHLTSSLSHVYQLLRQRERRQLMFVSRCKRLSTQLCRTGKQPHYHYRSLNSRAKWQAHQRRKTKVHYRPLHGITAAVKLYLYHHMTADYSDKHHCQLYRSISSHGHHTLYIIPLHRRSPPHYSFSCTTINFTDTSMPPMSTLPHW